MEPPKITIEIKLSEEVRNYLKGEEPKSSSLNGRTVILSRVAAHCVYIATGVYEDCKESLRAKAYYYIDGAGNVRPVPLSGGMWDKSGYDITVI